MKTRYYIDKKGEKHKIVRLNQQEKHDLRQKNLQALCNARLFKETVGYADYTVVDDTHTDNDAPQGS